MWIMAQLEWGIIFKGGPPTEHMMAGAGVSGGYPGRRNGASLVRGLRLQARLAGGRGGEGPTAQVFLGELSPPTPEMTLSWLHTAKAPEGKLKWRQSSIIEGPALFYLWDC